MKVKGIASKYNVKCEDGLIIQAGAFSHEAGKVVPFVFQHNSKTLDNILGSCKLEPQADGLYCTIELFPGSKVESLIHNGAINSLSIHATNVESVSRKVMKADIVEVSAVLHPANPGAKIINIQQSGDVNDEIFLHGLIEDIDKDDVDSNQKTINPRLLLPDSIEDIMHGILNETLDIDKVTEILDDSEVLELVQSFDELTLLASLDKQQKDIVEESAMRTNTFKHATETSNVQKQIAKADEDKIMQIGYRLATGVITIEEAIASLNDGELVMLLAAGPTILKAVKANGNKRPPDAAILQQSASVSKDIIADIVDELPDVLHSLRESRSTLKSFIEPGTLDEISHAVTGNITDTSVKTVAVVPSIEGKRPWFKTVIENVKNLPFGNLRSIVGDDTAAAARALGFTPGNQKTEEVIAALNRTINPTTIYKVQSLSTDDMADITDFDVVKWLHDEMVIGLDRELARAILTGDGRSGASPYKIDETRIIPIAKDVTPYTTVISEEIANTNANTIASAATDAVINSRSNLNGGKPFAFVAPLVLSSILRSTDNRGRRIYRSVKDVESKWNVKKIVPVSFLTLTGDTSSPAIIIADLSSYSLGNGYNKKVNSYDDFDIDFNKYKYLKEIRVSGGLTKAKSAVVITFSVG